MVADESGTLVDDASPSARLRSGEARIDSPHTLGDAPPAAACDDFEAAAAEPALRYSIETPHGELLEQLRNQARQLAVHLRGVQADVDRRESQLNADLSLIDRERRDARLWFQERHEELRERAEQAAQAERAHAERLEESQLKQAELDRRSATLDSRAKKLDARRAATLRRDEASKRLRQRAKRDARLRRQRTQVESSRAAEVVQTLLAASQSFRRRLAERERELDEREAAWQRETERQSRQAEGRWQQLLERESRLAEAEAALVEQQAASFAEREELSHERRKMQLRRETEEAAATEDHRRAEEELDERRQAVERAGEQVDRRRAALDQLQAELRELHRETLESQLATEELRNELQQLAPAATLTNSVARLRGRLADHFRLVNEDLVDQRLELSKLREQLVEQHERVATHRREVQQWFARRQGEVEQQAARLCDRELELERQESQLAELRERWHRERLGYQAEIRRLLATSRCEELAT